MSLHTAFISLGSNQGDTINNLRCAIALLPQSVELVQLSPIYRTEPQGDPNQLWFSNQVARIATHHSASELLTQLLTIETTMGRIRDPMRRFGPRPIDLDLLTYDSSIICTPPQLEIPHPRMHLRAFVLIPLADLDAGMTIPERGTVRSLLTKLEYRLEGDKIFQSQ